MASRLQSTPIPAVWWDAGHFTIPPAGSGQHTSCKTTSGRGWRAQGSISWAHRPPQLALLLQGDPGERSSQALPGGPGSGRPQEVKAGEARSEPGPEPALQAKQWASLSTGSDQTSSPTPSLPGSWLQRSFSSHRFSESAPALSSHNLDGEVGEEHSALRFRSSDGRPPAQLRTCVSLLVSGAGGRPLPRRSGWRAGPDRCPFIIALLARGAQ